MPTGWFQKKKGDSGDSSPGKASVVAKVKISQLLTPETVTIMPAGKPKGEILEFLVRTLCEKRSLGSEKTFLAKVLEREKGISTTLDTGLSLPHARMDALGEIVAALTVIPEGVPDPSQTDLTIRLMFLFFSPNKAESFPLHLQLLRGVSSLFQPSLIDELVRAGSPASVFDLIRKAEG